MSNVQEVRERLSKEDAAYQRLRRKHKELEARLEELQDLRYLNDDERLEEVELKKRKLALKDQMELLVREAVTA